MFRKILTVLDALFVIGFFVGIVTTGIVVGKLMSGLPDDQNQAYVKELERRGFTSPVLKYGDPNTITYDVNFNNCRIRLMRKNGEPWAYETGQSSRVSITDVDAAKLTALAKELGIGYCLVPMR